MEKLIFKNMYLNIIIGVLFLLGAILGYFVGWMEDFLPHVIAVILVLLSLKRFIFSFKKTVSKNATLILVIEFFLDVVFAGLIIYLQDYYNLFIGLIIYTRGVSYLLINYIATRKIKVGQYLLNIGFITLGSFFMFTSINSEQVLITGIATLIFIVGIIFLQAGFTDLVKKEDLEEAKEEQLKQDMKLLKEKQKAELEGLENNQKAQEKIDKLEDQVKTMKEEQKTLKKQVKETEKEVKEHEHKEQAEPEEKKVTKEELEDKTVAELKDLAKAKDLSGYSSLKKAELIDLLLKQ